MKEGSFHALQAKNAKMDNLSVKHLNVDELQISTDAIVADVQMQGKTIKRLYEREPNTNAYTDNEKKFVSQLQGTNSCVNGGMAVVGDANRITGKSVAVGGSNVILKGGNTVIGSNNMLIHEDCTVIGNGLKSSKNGQTVIGGNPLTFMLPLVDDVLENDIQEQGMALCIDPQDGSLLFKVKFMGEIRIFRAPTYGQTIRLNPEYKNNRVNINMTTKNI
jgi:hypothetical protein